MRYYIFGFVLLFFDSFLFSQNISGIVNDYAEVTAINNCTVTVVSSAGFSANDRVLIIQMKGVEVDTNDVVSFGSIINYNNTGNYEINTIQSVVGNNIVLQFRLLRSYTVGHKVQLIRVPEYNNATINGVLTCQTWNGTTGGVLCFIDNGTTTFNANIDVSEKGFQGTSTQTTGWLNCLATYKMPNSSIEALKGESITILPLTATKGTGAPANGGGGGRTDNGGGGGANLGAGGEGGNLGWAANCNLPAQGGKALTYNNALNKIFLGGAGGDAQRSEGPGTNMGVSGGGIVIIISNAINGNNNSILATGKTAANTIQDGAGGGGGGGTVLIDASTVNSIVNVNTSGGKGGDAIIYTSVKCSGGGGGGGGALWVSTAVVNPNIIHTSNGGALGLSLAPATNAFPGQPGASITNLIIPISTLPCSCPNPPTINTINISHVSCFAGNNGSVSVSGSGTTAPYTYSWQPGGQTSSSATNLTAGVYSVTVTDNDGCWDSLSFTITQPSQISGTVTPIAPLCFGDNNGTASILAQGGVGPYQYSWSNALTGVNTTGLSAGNYSVIITDNNNCTQTINFTISNPPQLVAVINNTTPICIGSSGLLTSNTIGGTPNYSYLWNTGIATHTISASPTLTTVYTITVTDNNGCTSVASQTLIVNQLPTVAITTDTLFGCEPLCVNFTLNAPSATSALWSFGDGSTSALLNPTHCYTSSGVYSISVAVTDVNGCTNTNIQNNYINVYAKPTAFLNAIPQPTTLINPIVNFTNLSTNSTQWLWSFGDVANSASTQQHPSFMYSDTGSFSVQLIARNDEGCTDTITQTVIVNPDFALYIPNSFTPNGDGINDLFIPSGMGISNNDFEFLIFDRWGNLIFRSTSISLGWDGKANGGKNIAQIDTYVWKIKLTDALENKRQLVGKVSLIK